VTAQALINDARAAGVRLEVVGGKLRGEYPPAALEWVNQIKANAVAVAQALAAEGTCSQCAIRPGDAGSDETGDRWCIVCRDVDFQLRQGEVPAKLAGQGVRAAWAGALSELGELTGHPALPFKTGHAVPPGAAGWGTFSARASVEDMALVLARLRVLVDELSSPDCGAL
jgi:hypothetical protein